MGDFSQAFVTGADMIPEARFYRDVRAFAVRAPSYSPYRQVVRSYPTERHNLRQMAIRVYGDANEAATIMAAAGLSTIDSPLPEQDVVLPTREYLAFLRARAGITAPVRSVR